MSASRLDVYFVESLVAEFARVRCFYSDRGFYVDELDWKLLDGIYRKALQYIHAGERENAGLTLAEAIMYMERHVKFDSPVELVRGYLKRLFECTDQCSRLFTSAPKERLERQRKLWLLIANSWVYKKTPGVPAPDMSKFMLVESIATVFSVVVGIILPFLWVSDGYKIWIIPSFVVVMLAVASMSWFADAFVRAFIWLLILFIPLEFIFRPLQSVAEEYIILPHVFGLIVGVLWAYDIMHKRCISAARKYGLFTRIWCRRLPSGRYAVIVENENGETIWYREFRFIFSSIQPYLAVSLSIDYWHKIRDLTALEDDCAWVCCYPNFIIPRMVGLRRRIPADFDEAIRTTEGMSLEKLDEYLERFDGRVRPANLEEIRTTGRYVVSANAPW